MIAYPIRYPMGSDRPYPNRPRIARIESCRFMSLNVAVSHSCFSSERPPPALLPGNHHAAMHRCAARVGGGR